jgi:pimeloyl-ACP methyl ester carboxylesterase
MDRLIEGTRLRITGAGRPIVLLHGVGLALEMWEPLAGRLDREFRIIRYDLLGHGASAKPPPPYDLALFTDQLAAVMRNTEASPAVIVGFSMGALIAEGFALAHGQAVERLVLVNGVFDRSAEERGAVLARVDQVRRGDVAASVETAIERWFTPAFRARSPDRVAAIRKAVLANDVASFLAAYEVFATADADLARRIGDISCPTLAVTGSDDRRSTPEMALRLAGRLTRARSVTLEGQRHLTPIEVPDRLAELIRGFAAEPG